MTFAEISEKYASTYKKLENREKALKEKLESVEKRKKGWIDGVILPFIKEFAKETGAVKTRHSGPFGLGNMFHVYFTYANGSKICLTFSPGDYTQGIFYLVDENVDTGKYKQGSIGEVNGGNHPRYEIPDYADVQWFMKYATKIEPKEKV
jgi:hypothetical protein